ncbi:RDD family protein [Salegentibacter sp. HM20]
MNKEPNLNPQDFPEFMDVHIWVRAINFIIDFILWFFLAVFAVIMLDFYLPDLSHFSINFLAYTAMILLYAGYYYFSELNSQRTLGKFLTGTKVISKSGKRPGRKQILIRSLWRLFPVDFISLMFRKNTLHDKFSETRVVRPFKPLKEL